MAGGITISATSDIVTDQRVLRVAEYFHSMDYSVTLVGRMHKSSFPCDDLPFRVKRFNMLFRKGFLFYKFFNIRLFFYLLSVKTDVLWANDLDTLLPNFMVSRLKRKQLIYDAHEYFTGVPELKDHGFNWRVWKTIERMILPRIDRMVTVNSSIAALYRDEFGVDPLVVRNYGRKPDVMPESRTILGIGKDDLLVVLQGTGINRGRGGCELVKAISYSDGVYLLVIGSGSAIDDMKKQVMQLDLQDRVTFMGPVKWERMIACTMMADIGVSLDSGSCPNYLYSLPNKIFDYMNAGLAVIATDLPEVSGVINSSGCGIIINNNDPQEIADAIKRLKNDRDLLLSLKKNSVKAGTKYFWEDEIAAVRKFL